MLYLTCIAAIFLYFLKFILLFRWCRRQLPQPRQVELKMIPRCNQMNQAVVRHSCRIVPPLLARVEAHQKRSPVHTFYNMTFSRQIVRNNAAVCPCLAVVLRKRTVQSRRRKRTRAARCASVASTTANDPRI